MDPPPWSQSQLKKLGRCISQDIPVPDGIPQYGDVLVWYNDLAAEVQARMAKHDWTPILGDRQPEITSRAKTIDTLRQKLRRDHATPLASIQDVAGVRFEAEMSLDEQDLIAKEVSAMFGHDHESCLRDMRNDPHSGYRAVHLWLRLAGRVEVQVRTHLQGDWANSYESLADFLGREIRYGHIPGNADQAALVKGMHVISTAGIASLEKQKNDLARKRVGYASALSLLARYDDADTLPRELVEAQEADVRVGELQKQVFETERSVRARLSELKRMFDRMSKGGK